MPDREEFQSRWVTLPVLPPRPDGGYPDEFFDSWGTTAETFAPWFDAYIAGVDDHSDYMRWTLGKVARDTGSPG